MESGRAPARRVLALATPQFAGGKLRAQSQQITQLARVATMGELTGALAHEIIRRMRSLLQRTEPQFKRVEIDELVRDALLLVRSTVVERSVELSVHIDRDIPALRGDLIELEQVLVNLLMNACEQRESRGGIAFLGTYL